MTNDSFKLELAQNTNCQLSRIGYEDEGLRLTFFDTIPFNAHFEIQLSLKDTQKLIKRLQQALEENENLK